MKLSVVIPFHNERHSIEPVLQSFLPFVDTYDFEVICVNDASSDDTHEVFQNALATAETMQYPFIRYINILPDQHVGYGDAIMRGVREAKGDAIAWTHSDLQTDIADVFRAYDRFIEAGAKNVIVKGQRIGRNLKDTTFSFGMAVIASATLGHAFSEINAQPKLFPREFLTHLEHAPGDFSLDLYLLHQAKRQRVRIITIDVLFSKRLHGTSAWAYSFSSKVKTISRTIRYIFRLRKHRRRSNET